MPLRVRMCKAHDRPSLDQRAASKDGRCDKVHGCYGEEKKSRER